jgi:Zn-finger nucleic acid-binding protein
MTRTGDLKSCPACREHTLAPAQLDPLLPSHACTRCGGQFIRGEHYRAWLEHPERKPSDANPQTSGDVHDSTRAMLCPECGKLLARYRVGHGLSFFIDRCAGCGGIWLDANEWQALARTGLTDRIHLVFSTAWQAQILREQQQRAAEQRLVERIGQQDFDRLKELADWVETHPHFSEISAYLMEHLRSREPPKNK